jgi:hypothetical protein
MEHQTHPGFVGNVIDARRVGRYRKCWPPSAEDWGAQASHARDTVSVTGAAAAIGVERWSRLYGDRRCEGTVELFLEMEREGLVRLVRDRRRGY